MELSHKKTLAGVVGNLVTFTVVVSTSSISRGSTTLEACSSVLCVINVDESQWVVSGRTKLSSKLSPGNPISYSGT